MLENYIRAFSTEGLQKMHLAALNAFILDEKIPDGEEKMYGVRQYSDWKEWSDALELVLEERKATFTKIAW